MRMEKLLKQYTGPIEAKPARHYDWLVVVHEAQGSPTHLVIAQFYDLEPYGGSPANVLAEEYAAKLREEFGR